MGFEGGNDGVKLLICNLFGRATQRNYSVRAALTDMAVPYDTTVLIMDGNCKGMAVRKDTKTLDEYVAEMLAMTRRAMATARVVVLCFDDPTLVPPTKRQTQARRDARASGSGQLAGYPVNGDFDVATLGALPDCHPLIENREMRYRLFDEVFSRVLLHVRQDVAKKRAEGYEGGVLVLDGIDLRGAGRRPDMSRRPGVHGTNADTVAVVASLERTEGEADIHMLTVETRLREGVELGQVHLSTIVHETIDTDSFAIALRHHANRVNRKMAQSEVIHTYIAMSESSKYASQELALTMNVPSAPSGVLIVDVDTLYVEVMTHICGVSWREDVPEPAARVALVQMLVAVWALGGCDFVDKLASANLLTSAFVNRVRMMQRAKEQWSEGLKPWFTSADVPPVLQELRRIVKVASDVPTAAKNRVRILAADDASYLRAAWTSAYWGGTQQQVFGTDRKKVLSDEYGDDPPDAPLPTVGRPYNYSKWGFAGVPDGTLVLEAMKRGRADEASSDSETSDEDEEGGKQGEEEEEKQQEQQDIDDPMEEEEADAMYNSADEDDVLQM